MSDVFILDEHARKGLGRWLVQQLLIMRGIYDPPGVKPSNDGSITSQQLLYLRTGTAQKLYERFADFKVITTDNSGEVNIWVGSID
jgi:hypothetical protein